MQLPAESSAEERAQFTKEMESLAVPMEEKGIESIAQAFEAAKKFGLRDGRVAELQDELDKLNLKPELKARPVVVVPAVALPEFPLSTAQGGAR